MLELIISIKQFLIESIEHGVPLAFFYAIFWIPSFIFLVGLQYYAKYSELPPNLRALRRICMFMVATLPIGLYLAIETLAFHGR